MFPARFRALRSLSGILSMPSLLALGLCLLIGLLALPTAFALVRAWSRNPDYEFAWLLAPVVAWLFIRARPWQYAAEPSTLPGLLYLLSGGLVHLAAQVITVPLLAFVAWFLLGRGLVLSLWGRAAARAALPVLLFSFFLFPLPLAWLNEVALWMQNVISRVAAGVLGLVWVCHRQGNVIHLAGLDTPLSVAVECSGVRQLLVFAACGSLLSLFLQGGWRRAVMITASLPIAVLANLGRVLALAVLARSVGASAIQGAFHDAPLLLTLPLGGVCLWFLFTQLKMPTQPEPERSPYSQVNFGSVLLVLSVLAVVQLALQLHLHAANTANASDCSISLLSFPETVGSWHGRPHADAARIADQAAFADETLTRVYTDDRGNAVALYLVFSRTGRDREHHPEICLRDAGGARELPAGRRLVPLDQGSAAQRFAYQRDRLQRTTVYYWHYTVVSPRDDLSLLQSLYLRQQERLPSVSVQIQVNVTDPQVWKTIESTFLPAVHARLREQLPAHVKVGCDRVPIRFTIE